MPIVQVLIIENDLTEQLAIKQQVEQQLQNCRCELISSTTNLTIDDIVLTFNVIIFNIDNVDEVFLKFLSKLEANFIPAIALSQLGREDTLLTFLQQGTTHYLIQDANRNYLKLLPITLQKALQFAWSNKQFDSITDYKPFAQDSIHHTTADDIHVDAQQDEIERIQSYLSFGISNSQKAEEKQKRQQLLLNHQRQILELMASDAPLSQILNLLVTTIEEQANGLLGSVLLLRGNRLWYGAAPNLPDSFSQVLMSGIEIGSQAGSCGTAAYRREPVVVTDIATDPLWDGARDLALQHNLHACWSTPIFSRSGDVLGTFAFYHQSPYVPNADDWELVNLAVHLAALAIECKQVERSLYQSEERFRITFEQAAVGICHASPDGHLLQFNQTFCDILGYSSQELQSLTFQEITYPDDLPENLQQLHQLLRGHLTTYSLEKRYIRKDRTIIWLNLTVSLTQNTDSDAPYLIGVIEDITNRKQSEQLLEESESRFRSIFEQAAVGMCYSSLGGQFLRVNQRFCDIVGYLPEELLACTFREITHPNDLDQDLKYVHQLLAGELKTYTLEKRYFHRDGSIIWVNLTVSLMRNVGGDPKHFIGVIEDITRRKQAELQRQEAIDALHQLNQELEIRVEERTSELQQMNYQLQQAIAERQKLVSLVENSTDFIALATPSGHVTYLNPAGRQMVGLDESTDITNFVIPDFHFSEDWEEFQRTVLQTLANGDSWQGEIRLRHFQTQASVPVAHSAFPIKHPHTGGVLAIAGIARDITERKKIEEQLRDLSNRLSLAVKSAGVGIWDWDIVNNQVFWDDRMYELYGLQRSDFANAYEAWLHAIHPEDRVDAETISLQARQGKREYNSEFRVIHPDGSIHFIQAYAFIQRNEFGEPLRMVGINFDITDRKQAEARTRESEAALLEAQRVAHIGNWEFDVNTQTIRWSEELYRMFGLDPSQPVPIYSDYLLKIHPSDRQTLIDCVNQAIAHGTSYCVDYRAILPDGSIRYHEGRGEVIQDAHGRVVKLFGTALDISDRKQVEIELKRSRELRDAIFNKSADALFLVDPITELIFDCNERAVEMFEMNSKKDLLNINGNTLQRQPFSDEELAIIIAEVTETGFWSREIEYITRKGRTFWANIAGTTVLVAGEPIRLVRLTDIDDRKQIELLLQQQLEKEQLLVSILKRIRDSLDLNTILNVTVEEVRQTIQADRILVYRLNEDGSGQVVAESTIAPWQPLLNLSFSAEVLPSDCFERYLQGAIYRIEDCNQANLADCAREFMVNLQIRAKLVIPIVQQEDKRVWGLLIAHECSHPRHWEGWEIALMQQLAGQLAIAIRQADLYQQLHIELEERQRAEDNLQKTNEKLYITNLELARATRLKDEFLANVSHELRTPLNAILGMSEMLQEPVLGELNTQQRKAISTVEESGRHLLDLINDILDLAKIEAGKLELNIESHSVQSLCNATVNLVKQLAHSKRIQISYTIAPDLNYIHVDDRRIKQVLINLLSNAIKFTPEEGRVTLDVWSQSDTSTSHPQHFLCFSVTDTGIGIASADLPKLFQSFVQIDSNFNRQYNGTGLGLALVKRIVELHHGRVKVESTVDQGSKFTIILPYQPSAEATHQAPLKIATIEPFLQSSSSNKRDFKAKSLVLLAEDNQANIETFSNYLMSCGYQIVVATDGLEAVSLSVSEKPNLILMDIQIPKLDGLEAIRQIRSHSDLNNTPIIALTALAMPGDRERCIAVGANDYLTKPVRLRYLASRISELLQK
ncbi:PAS domain S-box protein [Oscillatoria sp. FACHB-1407]|uniref:PAS domain S-box protein n=1 Tax=Oscillatoria sp. FACHB-1407 TaxID=2692847 RepID=UPI00168741C5|nr:PAS domain S-box protein [Oscillatoria sp. FACHB-1407]MBD2463458.1 PAS domain S-box protein [Oscillatoria sp. FACHB-1407]